jgi:type III restriction enzyme
MQQHEVPEPILCSPFDEPDAHWHIVEHEPPEKRPGRRPAMYFYRRPGASAAQDEDTGTAIELKLVNRIRKALAQWRPLALSGEGGVSRTTMELMNYWRREGRSQRLFFAQLEAAETVIFLNEARADFRQGIAVPTDEPSEERRAEGYRAFRRLGCKMATGSGKTTVMGMVAAWSILNKVNDRSDARFSDVVLVVCPNVTIRNRLAELNPELGEASLYRTRDLVPSHLMPQLSRGRVLVSNWHRFEPQGLQIGGVGARVNRAGRPVRVRETIRIGAQTRTVRGSRYLAPEDLERQLNVGLLRLLSEQRDRDGALVKVEVESVRYVESDTAVVDRVLDREVGGKRNILVMNDEAHHAYRIRREEPDEGETDVLDEEEADAFFREATVWVDGLDRIHRLRGINFCLDLSATPYYLGRVGQETNRIFPWVVSDFGLVDAIESGLTKIPQLAVRDTSGAAIPGYFNIWRWILPKLTPAERGGRKEIAKPEAILKYANVPIAMMGGLWEELRLVWDADPDEPRPPVLIVVCKNTKLAKVVYDWLAEDRPPVGIPSANLPGLRNGPDCANTIRVDSKVVQETDSGEARSDETRWMRLVLDTVGKTHWPADSLQRPIYPPGFESLAGKLGRPLYPPGRDVRCIVSVGMLTEGWDCNTVTHIVGLRPFLSQLLCEQVVGRGLRRTSYAVNADGRLSEEVAQIFGVPFQIIPFKQNPGGGERIKPPKTWRIHALPERADLAIRFPRVEGYTQAVRGRVRVDWDRIAPLRLTPDKIPPEVEMKAGLPSNVGRPSLLGPGRLNTIDLNPFRRGHRVQELVFELARDLTRDYLAQPGCTVPAHALFPQIAAIVQRYLSDKVVAVAPAEPLDAFLSPYYGWMIERLVQEIRPVDDAGEGDELARYESNRGPGSTLDVDFRTRREPYPVLRSHVNAVVPDTQVWEQSAAYRIDRHPGVRAFVKNAGLGFAIPYLHNGQPHDYLVDFVIRLETASESYLILETKGYDPLKEVKSQAAWRWVRAVNREGSFGRWSYALVEDLGRLDAILSERVEEANADAEALPSGSG